MLLLTISALRNEVHQLRWGQIFHEIFYFPCLQESQLLCHTLVICSPVEGHLGSFQVLDIVNKAAVYIALSLLLIFKFI